MTPLVSFAGDYHHAVITNVNDTLPAASDTAVAVFEKVEEEASFSGGLDSWREFLMANLDGDVPAKKGAPAGRYTVIVQFIVSKEGKISNIRGLTSHGFGMEEEVIRTLKKSPRWNPAMQNGRPVNAYRKQPISFQVIDERKNKRKGL